LTTKVGLFGKSSGEYRKKDAPFRNKYAVSQAFVKAILAYFIFVILRKI